MRSRTWIGAAAAAGLTTVAATGLAAAQERHPGQEQAPIGQQMQNGENHRAAGAMEKGAIQRGERARSAQAQSPGEERLNQGKDQQKMGEQPGKGEQGEAAQGPNANQPQREKIKTGQANQPAEAQKGATRGQAPANENRAGQAQTGAAQMENKQQNAQAAGQRHVNAQNVRAEGNAHLTKERAARVADTLLATATTQNVNANLAVGEAVPGDARLLPLPPTIVSLVPEYRDYDYVVVNDEIAIVQPSTRHVVEIINPGAP